MTPPPSLAALWTIVCKFGGSSLADAAGFRQARDILLADRRRRFVVVSAPAGVTNLLLEANKLAKNLEAYQTNRHKINEIYAEVRALVHLIVDELGLTDSGLHEVIEECLDQALSGLGDRSTHDFAASRGEHLSGRILAVLLNWEFVDAAGMVIFHQNRTLNQAATEAAMKATLDPLAHAVIPGWYGTLPDGTICVFGRGGSDISGAWIAAAMDAAAYEKWTDTPLCVTDPRIIRRVKRIARITPGELEELGARGAKVFNPDAVGPVADKKIPILIRNTMDPDQPGTVIEANDKPAKRPVTGMAVSHDYTVVTVVKRRMSKLVGYVFEVLGVLKRHNIPFDQMATGTNTVSVAIATEALKGRESDLANDIKRSCTHNLKGGRPDDVRLEAGIALITVVGRGMVHHPGVAARIFTALGRAGINVVLIDQAALEMTIVVGVREEDNEAAIRAIYRKFFGPFWARRFR